MVVFPMLSTVQRPLTSFEVTDPDLDAPDGSILNLPDLGGCFERVGSTWILLRNLPLDDELTRRSGEREDGREGLAAEALGESDGGVCGELEA